MWKRVFRQDILTFFAALGFFCKQILLTPVFLSSNACKFHSEIRGYSNFSITTSIFHPAKPLENHLTTTKLIITSYIRF